MKKRNAESKAKKHAHSGEVMPKKKLKGKATEKQKDFLRKLGVSFKRGISKQLASEKISQALAVLPKADSREFVHSRCGSGEMIHSFGQMVYCDDGNGNVWDADDPNYNDDCY